MRRHPRSPRPAAFGVLLPSLGVLLIALLLATARVGGADVAKPANFPDSACAALPGPAPDQPPRVLSDNGVNLRSPEGGAAPLAVPVCVRVDELGIVRAVQPIQAGSPYDPAALESARWWLFEPARRQGKPVPATLAIGVGIPPLEDVEPLAPDVHALALDAETRGDVRGAIDAWTGVLVRVGAHPTLGDPCSVRLRVLTLAAQLSPWPEVPRSVNGRARGARNLMQRNIARGANADYARTLDEVLRAAPWFVDAYRWRAAACAASGRRFDAIRDVICYRSAVADSASRALADRALQSLVLGDTLGANSLLKH